MADAEMRVVIEMFLSAYNAFDIEGMMAVIHPDVEFKNIAGGEVNATASGADEFRALAEQSKRLFSSRRQTITFFEAFDDVAFIDVSYDAVLAVDMPDGMKAGETIHLEGRSEFGFKNGKISSLTDIS